MKQVSWPKHDVVNILTILSSKLLTILTAVTTVGFEVDICYMK